MTGRENKVGLVGFGKKFVTLATKPKLPRKVAYFSQLSMIISEYRHYQWTAKNLGSRDY